MANTLLNSHQNLINYAIEDLVDSSALPLQRPIFQGTNFGYTSGGKVGPTSSTVIDKFPFASDGNATDVGDLLSILQQASGQSSTTHGYTSGGIVGPQYAPSRSIIIHKFSFASDGNAIYVGDLTIRRGQTAGQSSAANGYGYTSGGDAQPNLVYNVIDRFSFSADGTVTDVGDLTIARAYCAGQSADESGYTSGGYYPSPALNVIDKFPFTSDRNATDVGDLTIARWMSSGQSSSTHGYTCGSWPAPTAARVTIDKFPFASDGNATDVGDLTAPARGKVGQSSTLSGYNSGGQHSAGYEIDVIDKFPFSTDANTTDVGDLTVARGYNAGQQY